MSETRFPRSRLGPFGFRNRENRPAASLAIAMERSLLLPACVSQGIPRAGCEYATAALAISVMLAMAVDAGHPEDARHDTSLYEPGDVEMVAGQVARVEALPRAGGRRDVTVVVTTGIGDEVQVAVAPQWVVRAMGLRLHAGNRIQVTGWRIVRGKPSLIAAEIIKDTQLFVFRDRHGVAVWGPRRRLKRRTTHRVDRPER